jgi:hypothetical protein
LVPKNQNEEGETNGVGRRGRIFFLFFGGGACFFLSFLSGERGKRYASSISFSLWFCPEMKRERERERERLCSSSVESGF